MALQLVLPFARALVWATKRPTTVLLRRIRALRGAAFRAAGRIHYPEPTPKPSWASKAAKAARDLAAALRKAQLPITVN